MKVCEKTLERYALLGEQGMSDMELIALILGCDLGRSSLVMEVLGSVREIADSEMLAISAIPGIGKAKAVRLHAALQLGRRAAIRQPTVMQPINSVVAAVDWFQSPLQGLDHEELHALYLDRKFRPLRYRKISSGSDGCTVVEPRQVLKPAIEMGAVALVIAHNHPSGDSEPSPEDRLLTRRLFAGAETLGIRLIDHLVIAGERWVSLAERGELS